MSVLDGICAVNCGINNFNQPVKVSAHLCWLVATR